MKTKPMKLLYFFLIPYAVYATSLTISGNPSPLIISRAIAGKEPSSSINTSTTYKIQVDDNQTVSIFAALDSPLPHHTILKVTLAAPPLATRISSISLNTTPQIVVVGIPSGTYDQLAITYEYLATVAAGIVPLHNKTLLLTIVSNGS